jgi:rare lipoprotein A (peptidoglycan hydrolase)
MQSAPEATHATQTIKKVKPGKAQSVEIAPSAPVTQPVQVAILGAANLKAALPAETAAPIETPRPADEPNVPTARPEPKSACNGGQRVVSAYYWEGRHTASGQLFNPRGMTAAQFAPAVRHPSQRDQSALERPSTFINDRGPYVRGQPDLSLAAQVSACEPDRSASYNPAAAVIIPSGVARSRPGAG